MNSTRQCEADRDRSLKWPPSDRQFVAGGLLLAVVVWLTSSTPVSVLSPEPISVSTVHAVPVPADELVESEQDGNQKIPDATDHRAAVLEARLAVELLKAEVAAMTDVEVWARTEMRRLRSE